jgi:hypothetical protein
MGYSRTESWGNTYEVLAGLGIAFPIDSVVDVNDDVGDGQFPTHADLDFGQVVGAFCDVCIPSVTNTAALDNWLRADAGYPTVQVVPTGHGAIDVISNLTLGCYCPVTGTFNYGWINGDTNFASIFTPGSHYFGHNVSFYLHNIRAESDTLRLNNFIFRFRFYVR